jgi:hypothetical protein
LAGHSKKEKTKMKFMITWSINPAHQKDTTARFLQTGGGPPSSVKMLGRWHSANTGFVLAETNDAKGLYEWTARWADLITFVVCPVIEDAEAADVLKRVG